MTKPTPSRMVALATLAAMTVALAAPAYAMSYSRNATERGGLIFVPDDSDCTSHRGRCDMARYY